MSEQIRYTNRVGRKVDRARSQTRLKVFLIPVLVENLMLPVMNQLKQWFHSPLLFK